MTRLLTIRMSFLIVFFTLGLIMVAALFVVGAQAHSLASLFSPDAFFPWF